MKCESPDCKREPAARGRGSALDRYAAMRYTMRHLLLAAVILSLTGCDHRHSIGGGFELRQSESWNPDGHPGTFLYYNGKEVWHQVAWGYPDPPEKFCHDGIFVFESPVPDTDGRNNYGISPQLYATRASGPPVLISQRIIGQPLRGRRIYSVENSSVTENGVRVEFEYWVDENHEVMKTNDVSWSDVANWVQEAEHSSPELSTPLGSYRLLP